MQVEKFSKKSFIELLTYIIENIPIKKVYFSQHEPHSPSCPIEITKYPSIDFTISGQKHILFPSHGKVQDKILYPGEIHYSSNNNWRSPVWDLVHEMSSIVFYPEYIRFTYIDVSTNDPNKKTIYASAFYHTSKPVSKAGRNIIEALDETLDNPDPEIAVYLLKALVRIAFQELKKDKESKYSKAYFTWLQLYQYINDNFRHHITRHDVAKTFNLSPNYISRLFMEKSGESFKSTLRKLRFKHATMLLKNTNLSMDEITCQCGYQSSTFFISKFKGLYGVTPGQYRHQNK